MICKSFKVSIFFGIFAAIVILPRVRCLECYKCNSDERSDCANKPGEQLPVNNCKDKDMCVTAIVNKVTHRGCLSDILPGRSCSPNGGNLCIQCKTNLCNSQLFPPDRRSCYQCLGDACIDILKSKVKPTLCRNYVKDDTCFSDFISIHNTVRGCASDRKDACRSMKCTNCNFDNCNDLVGVREHKCYSCSYMKNVPSYSNPSCKRSQGDSDRCVVSNVTTCVNKVLLGDKGRCFTFYNEKTDVVMRGCTSNMGAMIGGKLTECYDDLCNDQCVDIKCVVCDSDKNQKCSNAATHVNAETCPPGTQHCLSCEDTKGHVIRGCRGNIEGYKNHQHCLRCNSEDGCNRGNVRTCYSCTSAKTPDCARWTNTSNIGLEVCKDALDDCVATSVPNSYTVRGCKQSVPECTQHDPNCKQCSGSLCNDDIVPPKRILCHQCNGTAECNEEQKQSEAQLCVNYSLNDYCFAYADTNNNIIRGCASDANFNDCRKQTDGKCRVCYENGCNSWALVGKPKLSCIKCKNTDKECAWGYNKERSSPCNNTVPYFAKETCYIHQYSSGNVSRGCSLDLEFKLKENDMVHLCHSPGCNNKNIVYQNCIQCTSRSEPDTCSNVASKVSSQDCSRDILQRFENHGCFVLKNPEGDVIRGCAIDLNKAELNNCKDKKTQCIYCTTQGCNKQRPPSSAGKLIFSNFLIILVIIYYLYN